MTMKEAFGELYKSSKKKKDRLPTLQVQKELLPPILHAEEPTTEGFGIDRKGVMFKDEIFQQFLRTPSLNHDARFYINLLQKNGKLLKKAFSVHKCSNTQIKVSYKDHLAQMLEGK